MSKKALNMLLLPCLLFLVFVLTMCMVGCPENRHYKKPHPGGEREEQGKKIKTRAIPQVPIAKLEVYQANFVREGLATLLSPTEAITSYHLLEGSNQATITLGSEKRPISWVKPIERDHDQGSLNDLYSDICYIGWKEPLHKSISQHVYPVKTTRHPTPDEIVYIPRMNVNNLTWEERYIVGLESYAIWTNLPRKIYSYILYLNNRPINKGGKLREGDSGGGWISESGEVLAITSRVVNANFGPSTQVVYGTLINQTPSPKKSGDHSRPALIPLLTSISFLTLATFLIMILKYKKGVANK